MTDRTIVTLVRLASSVGIALAVAGSAVLLSGGHIELYFLDSGAAFAAPFAVFFGVLAWLVVAPQPRNAVIWVMVISAFFWGLYVAGAGAFSVTYPGDPSILYSSDTLTPADLPTDAALVLTFTFLGWIPGLFLLTTLGMLLFPDGKLPSPRWRWVALLAVAAITVGVVFGSWMYRPGETSAYNEDTFADPLAAVVLMSGLLAAVLSLVALVIRFRRSHGETRQQFKWVVWGAAFFLIVVLPAFFVEGSRYEIWSTVLFYVGGAGLLTSYGIAVAKYRLYDIDVVISRTFVYGTLAVFITGVYVAVVVGLGQFFGGGDGPNTALAIAATTLIAVAFQPLRRRLQQLANRLVYGRRATPYEVLSTFSQRVAAVDPSVLTQIARALVEGTTAKAAGVWMDRGSEMQRMARWPTDPRLPRRLPAEEVSSSDRVAEVAHDGERLGLVTLSLQPGQPFSPADSELLDQVAAGLGLALRNLRLTDDLRARLDQLQDSRRRIVAVQDMTRRHLERDLHDGAQQRLVSLKIKLGIGSSMAEKAGLADVRAVLEDLRVDADQTIEAVRDFARGIYPPLLEAEGLGPALVSRTRRLPIPVTVQAAGISRYPRDQEATVYFCVLEAVQNAVEHSDAGSILVTLDESAGRMDFEVRDDGAGFDVDRTPYGSGLTNITDRLDAMDGSLDVTSHPGRGTAVKGTIPVRELVVAG